MKYYTLTLMVFIILGASVATAQDGQYICPMHPHYISDHEGTCPICGMDLVPLDPPQETTHTDDGMARAPVITLPSETIQLMGVRTQPAASLPLGRTIRSYGMIVPNERMEKMVYSKVEGWITDLGVSAEGDQVREKDHLYTIHSPDLVLAQRDYLAFREHNRAREYGKLFTHYDIDENFASELVRSKEVKQDVPYYSPFNGTVAAIHVRPGSYVTLETPLFVLEDYASVWVYADVAEQDIASLTVGGKATIFLPNMGNINHEAEIDYIYPTVNTETRTGRVRLIVENPDGILKPGAYADVMFESSPRERLAIPNEAILRDREGEHVIIALGNGQFSPRHVKTGIVGTQQTEIIHGLKAGEEVVVNGQFLIDSESSLRAAFGKMNAGGEHAGH